MYMYMYYVRRMRKREQDKICNFRKDIPKYAGGASDESKRSSREESSHD